MIRYVLAALAALIIVQFLFISHVIGQRDDLRGTVNQLSTEVKELVADAALLQKSLTATQELDKKYTEELTNAKANLDQLRDDLRASTKRVYVNASCPAPVRPAASPTSVDDATGIRLSEDATEDYLRLRRELEADRIKIEGLQTYITDICLRSNDGS